MRPVVKLSKLVDLRHDAGGRDRHAVWNDEQSILVRHYAKGRDQILKIQERLARSQWDERGKDLFRRNLDYMRRRGLKEAKTWLCAWHIGEIGFAGLPGEVFCQHGMRLKEKSPFPWTIPVELCGDCLGYFVTRQAWEAGGYEGLVSTIAPVSVEGVERMMRQSRSLLAKLKRQWAR